MKYPVSRKRMVIDCIHYCSSSLIMKNRKIYSRIAEKMFDSIMHTRGDGFLDFFILRKRQGEDRIMKRYEK